jgi:hypothetical protein
MTVFAAAFQAPVYLLQLLFAHRLGVGLPLSKILISM